MLVIKDAMILMHLAKTALLDESCRMFDRVLIPMTVYEEVMKGEQRYPHDARQLRSAIARNLIKIKKVLKRSLITKANELNIYRGEAEAVALYWQENADLLATDDDNVRKKRDVLQISTIGTPAILIRLFKMNKTTKEKYLGAIKKLKEVGWFSSTVFDKMLLEAEHG